MATRPPFLSDSLPMAEWQRRRNLQAGGLEPVSLAGTPTMRLSDDLPMDEWQRIRNMQAQGGDVIWGGQGDDGLAGGDGRDDLVARKPAPPLFGTIGDAARAAAGFVGRQVQAFSEAEMEGERLRREQSRIAGDAVAVGGRRIVEALHPNVPTPAQTPALPAAAPRPPIPSTKREAARDFGAGTIGGRVAEGEGTTGPESYDTVYGYKKYYPPGWKKPTELTLDQITELQAELVKRGGGRSVGKYQMQPLLLTDVRKAMGLTGSELYTPELQDRMFRESLRIAGYDKYLAGKIDEKALQSGIARYWSSVADTDGYSTYDTTKSKRPRVSSAEIQATIAQAKAEADHLRDLGEDADGEAWR